MKNLFQARLLFISKRPFAIIFWLLFPIAATSCFMHFTGTAQNETRIPVALSVQDTSPAAKGLEQAMKSNSLLRVTVLEEETALDAIRRHEYDSLFVIADDFSKRIADGETRDLIKAYYSDRSLFFEPVKEIIIANIQAISGRMQAALTVQKLNTELNGEKGWSTDEIVKTANEIEQEQHLLQTKFHFRGTPEKSAPALLNPLLPWSAAALITTFFLFDSILKERREGAFSRLHFTHYGASPFILVSALIYTVMLFAFDLIAVLIFSELLDYKMILALIVFRLTASGLALTLSLLIIRLPFYYALSLLIPMLFAMTSTYTGYMSILNPLLAFANGTLAWLPLLILILLLTYIFRRKEFARA